MNYWKRLFFVFLLWPGFESTAQTTEVSLSESEILSTTLLSSDDLLNPVRINASTINGNLKLTSLEIMAKSTNKTDYIDAESKSSEGLSSEDVSRETNTTAGSQSDSSSYDEEAAKVTTDGIDSNGMTNDSATSGDAAIDERRLDGVLTENDNASENLTMRGLNGSDVDERDPSVEVGDLFSGPDTKTDEPIFQFSDPSEKNFFGITDDGLPVTETTTDLVLPLAFYDSGTKVGTSTYEDVKNINLKKSSPEREVKTVAEGNVDPYDSVSDVSESLSEENVGENEDDKSSGIEDRQETTTENEDILLTITPMDVEATTENSGYDGIHKNVTNNEEKVDVFTESTVLLEKETEIQLLPTEPSTVVEETDSKDDSKSDSGSELSESLESTTRHEEHKATSLDKDLGTTIPEIEEVVVSTSDESKSIISESVEDSSKHQSVENVNSVSVDISDSTEEVEVTTKTSQMSGESVFLENDKNTTDVLSIDELDKSSSLSSASQQKEHTDKEESEEYMSQDGEERHSDENVAIENITANTLNIDITSTANEGKTENVLDQSRFEAKLAEIVNEGESNSISDESKLDDKPYSLSSVSQENEGPSVGKKTELSPDIVKNSYGEETSMKSNASTLNIEVTTVLNEIKSDNITNESKFDNVTSEIASESESESIYDDLEQSGTGSAEINKSIIEEGSQENSTFDKGILEDKIKETTTELLNKTELENSDSSSSAISEEDENTTSDEDLLDEVMNKTTNVLNETGLKSPYSSSSDISEKNRGNATSDEADLGDDKVMETTTEVLNEAVLDDSDSISSSSQENEGQTEIDEIITSLNNNSNEGQSVESIETSTLNIEVNTEVNEEQTDSIVDESRSDSKSSEMVTEMESNSVSEDAEQSGRGSVGITKNISSYNSKEDKKNATSDEVGLADDKVMDTTTEALNEAVLDNFDSISSSSQENEGQTEINEPITSLDKNSNEGQSVESIEASTLNIEVITEINEGQTDSIVDESRSDSKSSEMVTEMESNSISEDVEQSGRGSVGITKNISSYNSKEDKKNTTSDEVGLADDKVMKTTTEVLNEAVLDNSDSISSSSQENEGQTEINEPITSLDKNSNEGQSVESIEASTLNIEVNTEVNEDQTDSIVDESKSDSKSSEMVTEIESNNMSENVEQSGRGSVGITTNISSYNSKEDQKNTTSDEVGLADDKVMDTTTEALNEAVLDNSDSISSSSQENEGQTEINEPITSLDNDSIEGQSVESIEASTLNIEVNTEINEDQTDNNVDESRSDSKSSEMVTEIYSNSMSEDVEQSGRSSLEITKNISSGLSEKDKENTTSDEADLVADEVMETTTEALNEAVLDNSDSISSSSQESEGQTEINELITSLDNNSNEGQSVENIEASTLNIEVNTEINEDQTDSIIDESRSDSKSSEMVTEIESNNMSENVEQSGRGSVGFTKNISSYNSKEDKKNATSDEIGLADDKVMETTTEALKEAVLDNSDSILSSSQENEGQTEIDEIITSLNNNSNEGQSVESIETSTLNIEVNTEVNEDQTDSIVDESRSDSKSSEIVTEMESNSISEDVEQSGRGSVGITKNISSYNSKEDKKNTTSDEVGLADNKIMKTTTEALNEAVLDDSDSISSSSQEKEGQIDEVISSLNNNSNEGQSVESIEASTLNIEVNTAVNEDQTDSIVDESRSDSKSSEMVTEMESNSISGDVEQSGRGSVGITKNISSYNSKEDKKNTTSDEVGLADDKVMKTTTEALNEAVLDNSDSISSSSQENEGQTEIDEIITSLNNNSNEGQSVETIETSTLNIEVNTEVTEDQTDSIVDESRSDSKSSEMVTEMESNSISGDVEQSGRGSVGITKNISSYNSKEDKMNTTSDEVGLADDKVMETTTEALNETVLDNSDSISSSSQENEGQTEINEPITSLDNDSIEGQSVESIEASTLNVEVNTEINENQTDSIIDESMFDSKSSEMITEVNTEVTEDQTDSIVDESRSDSKSSEMVTEIESNSISEDVEQSGRGSVGITKNISSYNSKEDKKNTTSDEVGLADDKVMETTTEALNEAVLDNSDSISSSSQENEGQTEINEPITSLDNDSIEGKSVESIEASTLNVEVNTEINENQTDSIIDESMFDSKSSEMVTDVGSTSMSEDVVPGSLAINKNISSGISEENEESITSGDGEILDEEVTEITTDLLNEAEAESYSSSSSSQQKEDLDTERSKEFKILTTQDNVKQTPDEDKLSKNGTSTYSPLIVHINIKIKINKTDNVHVESKFDNKTTEVVVENIETVAPGYATDDTTVTVIKPKEYTIDADEVTEVSIDVNTHKITTTTDMIEETVYPETSTQSDTEDISEEITTARTLLTSIASVTNDFEDDNAELFTTTVVSTEFVEEVSTSGEGDENLKLYANDFADSEDKTGDTVNEDSFQVEANVQNETKDPLSHPSILEEAFIDNRRNSTLKEIGHNESTNVEETDVESDDEEIPELEGETYESSYTSSDEFGSFFSSFNFSDYDEDVMTSSENVDFSSSVTTEDAPRGAVIRTVLNNFWNILSRRFNSSKENISSPTPNITKDVITTDVPYIQDTIFGRSVNFSIQIVAQNETMYVPTMSYLSQDPTNYTLNITWQSSSKGLNNSLWLSMMSVSRYLVINGAQMRIAKDGEMSIWKGESIVIPKVTSTANYSSIIKFEEGVVVYITSPDEDFLQPSNKTENKLRSKSEDFNIEIAMGATVSALILVVLIFVFVIKGWRRAHRREFKPELYYAA